MLKSYINRVVLTVIASVAIYGASNCSAKSCASDVLVVPSRFTIVQLAFDVVALRDVSLVAYETASAGEEPALYYWNKISSDWQDLTVDEYAVGAFSAKVPNEMILIGSDSDLPASLISGASQAKKVTRIDSLNVAPVVNELHKSMKFSSSEWKAIADKHGLELTDRNEERRRWGRYGPPEKSKIKKVSKAEATPMPPKALNNDIEDEFKALDFDRNDASKTTGLELPPEDVSISMTEVEDKPVELEVEIVEDTPVVITEPVITEVDEYNPENK